jgi:hypothetical protein
MTKVRRHDSPPVPGVADTAVDTAISLCWDAYHQVLRAHELGDESAALRAEATQLRRRVVSEPVDLPRGWDVPRREVAAREASALTPR